MVKRQLVNQSKWIVLALLISFVLVRFFENAVLQCSIGVKTQNTFLGLNLFLEILIFFVFSTFVVFGIKGYFEMYSQRFSNIILAISGVLLVFVIFILCYQILLLE